MTTRHGVPETGSVRIELLDDATERDVEDLAAVLVDCVDGGASVNFLAPLDPAVARAWWRAALADPAPTWVARDEDGTVVGCVRLALAPQPNAPHRAEVTKLLVTRSARGRGVAADLLAALESWAAAHGRHRLVLDTETGSPAQAVYERLGWTRVGMVPDYALTAAGELTATTILTKSLREA